VVDHRQDKTLDVDMNRIIRERLKKELEKRNYSVEMTQELGVASASTKDLALAQSGETPDWISSLGPADKRYVLLVSVESLEKEVTIMAKASAVIKGYLFDKVTSELLWEGAGYGVQKLGLLFAAVVENDALGMAARDMAKAFPVRQAS
jgi:hypothetical protein